MRIAGTTIAILILGLGLETAAARDEPEARFLGETKVDRGDGTLVPSPWCFRVWAEGRGRQDAEKTALKYAVDYGVGKLVSARQELDERGRFRDRILASSAGVVQILSAEFLEKSDGWEAWEFTVRIVHGDLTAHLWLSRIQLLQEYETLSAPRIIFDVRGTVEMKGVDPSDSFLRQGLEQVRSAFIERGLSVVDAETTARIKRDLKSGFLGEADVLRFYEMGVDAEILVTASFEFVPELPGVRVPDRMTGAYGPPLYRFDGNLNLRAVDLTTGRAIISHRYTVKSLPHASESTAESAAGALAWARDRLTAAAKPVGQVAHDRESFLYRFFSALVNHTMGAGVHRLMVTITRIPHDRLNELRLKHFPAYVNRVYQRRYSRGIALLEVVFRGSPEEFLDKVRGWRGGALVVDDQEGQRMELQYTGEDARGPTVKGKTFTVVLRGGTFGEDAAFGEYLAALGGVLDVEEGEKDPEKGARWTLRTAERPGALAVALERCPSPKVRGLSLEGATIVLEILR